MLLYISKEGRNPTLCRGIMELLRRKKEGMYVGAVKVSEVSKSGVRACCEGMDLVVRP